MLDAINQIKHGTSFFFKGQRFVFVEHVEILKFSLFPMLAGLIFFGLGLLGFWLYIGDLLNLIWAKPDLWLLQIVWYIFSAVTVAVSLVTVVLFSYFAFIITFAPFNDVISEKVEGIEKTFDAQPFSISFLFKDLWQTIVLELVKVLKKLAWIVPLYIISLVIPVIGQLIYIILGGYLLSISLGLEYTDWSLARRGKTAVERLEFGKKHRFALLGFGLCMTVCLMIPVVFVILWPGAVAGGTLLYTGLTRQDS